MRRKKSRIKRRKPDWSGCTVVLSCPDIPRELSGMAVDICRTDGKPAAMGRIASVKRKTRSITIK